MPCTYGVSKNVIDIGTPISGEISKEKAKSFYEKITHKEDFQASDGRLDKFKNRFCYVKMENSIEKCVFM